MLRLSDGRNFGRTLTGLALIVGPALLLIAAIIGSSIDADDAAERFAEIADNETAYVISVIVFLFASLTLLVASAGLLRLFRGRRVTLGQLAAGLLLLGSAATVGFYVFGAIEYEMATREGFDTAEFASFVDDSEEAGVFVPVFVIFLAGVVIGQILLGIAVWRTGVAPVAAALMIIAGAILTFAGGDDATFGIIAFAVVLAGLGWLGLSVLGMSDERWDAGAAAGEPGAAPPPPPPPPPPGPQ
ncbi:MAG: hypothetical protein ACRDK9_13555 [Solirubrobacterales bacterium]